MTALETRTIRRTAVTSRRDLAQVLTGICVAELLVPSRALWIAAPNLRDTVLLDNRAGAFHILEPRWGQRLVGLLEWLVRGLEMGTAVTLATTSPTDVGEDPFLSRLISLAKETGTTDRLRIVNRDILPRMGMLATGFLLSGVLRLESEGAFVAEEAVTLELRSDVVAEARSAFEKHYGGPPHVG